MDLSSVAIRVILRESERRNQHPNPRELRYVQSFVRDPVDIIYHTLPLFFLIRVKGFIMRDVVDTEETGQTVGLRRRALSSTPRHAVARSSISQFQIRVLRSNIDMQSRDTRFRYATCALSPER